MLSEWHCRLGPWVPRSPGWSSLAEQVAPCVGPRAGAGTGPGAWAWHTNSHILEVRGPGEEKCPPAPQLSASSMLPSIATTPKISEVAN